jgi:mono/diheme cytochrome c family protein
MRRELRVFTRLLLVAVGLGLSFCTGTAVGQDQGGASDASKALFSSRCAMCHGADGHGSEMGKSLKVKDLTSKEVQSQSDAQLSHVIAEGQNNMPPFKGSLKKEEITDLVRYLRTLK